MIEFLLYMFLTHGTLDHGRCSVCKAFKTTSRVEVKWCQATALHCGNPYYDEKGELQSRSKCNVLTCDYECSKGHKLITREPHE